MRGMDERPRQNPSAVFGGGYAGPVRDRVYPYCLSMSGFVGPNFRIVGAAIIRSLWPVQLPRKRGDIPQPLAPGLQSPGPSLGERGVLPQPRYEPVPVGERQMIQPQKGHIACSLSFFESFSRRRPRPAEHFYIIFSARQIKCVTRRRMRFPVRASIVLACLAGHRVSPEFKSGFAVDPIIGAGLQLRKSPLVRDFLN